MAYEAPPGPWRQFFALIGGMLLLLIFAPSGSSPSARVRSKKAVFNSADSGFGPEGSQGDESDRNIRGKARSTKERDGRATQLSTTAQKPINAEQHGLDPSKWKRLTAAHTVLKDEAIGEGISAADAQQQLEGIVLHLRETHNSAEEEGDEKKEEDVDSTKYYDRWYVLDGIPSTSNSTAFEIKVSFPIETPVDMDLVVTMWTLQAAQTQLPKDVSLSDHFPKYDSSECVSQDWIHARPLQNSNYRLGRQKRQQQQY
ncbi:hypothetical protein BGZ98_000073 [Dissophora globulifera]|nr:hypothetical protein BGZ98_000073 [Dissophora globulifera]